MVYLEEERPEPDHGKTSPQAPEFPSEILN
jgi:hypothetical protein